MQYSPSPDGLAQVFIIERNSLVMMTIAMVLGDNIFAGHGMKKRLTTAVENGESGKNFLVFGYYVDDPEKIQLLS